MAFTDPYPEFRCLMPSTSEFLRSQKGRALSFRGKWKPMLCDLSLITRGTCMVTKLSRYRSPKYKMKTVTTLVVLLAGLRVLM